MISFLTLFLGLIGGPHPVEVSAAGRVVAVEVLLDGVVVGRRENPPWSVIVDFGAELSPHELVARSLDEKGTELGLARQWINLPRPPAEIGIQFDRDARGLPIGARVIRASLLGARKPGRISATLDGRSLSVRQDGRLDLPPYDPTSVHLLTVRLEVSEAVRARTDLTIGGGSRSEADAELTPFLVHVRKKGRSPSVAELDGAFLDRGQPVRAVALEHGPAQVFVVRDLGADEAFRKLARGTRPQPAPMTPDPADPIGAARRSLSSDPAIDAATLRFESHLGGKDRVRFLWPMSKRYPDDAVPSDLFDASRDFSGEGLSWLLTRVFHPEGTMPQQRFSDAVAVAGLQAAASSTRRAVLFLVGSAAADSSRLLPASVVHYLRSVGVPLFVWPLDDPASDTVVKAWGNVQEVSSPEGFRKAFRWLKEELESQEVVWLEGRHLPQRITVSDRARELEPLP